MIVTDKNHSPGGPITPRQRADRYPASVTEPLQAVRPDVLVRLPYLGAQIKDVGSQPLDHGGEGADDPRAMDDHDEHNDKAADRRFNAQSRGQRRNSAIGSRAELLRRWAYPLGGVAVAVFLIVVVYRALTVGTDTEPQDTVPWNQDEIAIHAPGFNEDFTKTATSDPSPALSESDSTTPKPFGQPDPLMDPNSNASNSTEYVATHTPSNSYGQPDYAGTNSTGVTSGQPWNRTGDASANAQARNLTDASSRWSAPTMPSDSGQDGSARFDSTGPNPSQGLPGPSMGPAKLPQPSSDNNDPVRDRTYPQPSSGGGIETTYPATPYPESDMSFYDGRPAPGAYDAGSVRTARRPTAGDYSRDPNYDRDLGRGSARLERRIEQVPVRGYDYERN